MLDIKFVRDNFDQVLHNLQRRHSNMNLDSFKALEEERREIIQKTEMLKSKKNAVSKEISQLKKDGKDAHEKIEQMRLVGEEINVLDSRLKEIMAELNSIMLQLPNMLDSSVPDGKDDSDNPEIRRWGEAREFNFTPKAHWDIGSDLNILDFERAAKVTGARFTFYYGLGARLERALINFMMDLHVDKQGYTEMLAPFIANKESMTGTGQLPKFSEDMFKIEGTDYYLVPTGEVPATNYYRDEILSLEDLPKYFSVYTACFRAEAGSAGRDTRGLIRQHQFNKVEMIKFVKPEDSYEELEKMTQNAEEVLQLLNLPYRVVQLCAGDIGFTAAKTYDIEVYLPSYGTYREISSCSNVEDFQARRSNIKFRRKNGEKPEFVHTLNGSGLAVGRTVAAILENYQQEDGSVVVPEVLVPYMGGVTVIK